MSANNPPQICIKLLRDIKTDALLIYIKTVIEELLENIMVLYGLLHKVTVIF